MRREHYWFAQWYLTQVVDKDHAKFLEPIDHDFVVNDLVIAVHGSIECTNHPRKSLNRHFNACTKTAR